MQNNVGVLLPVSALPGKHGIGDFGNEAFYFLSWLSKKGFKYWQILPLNPVGPAYSPYLTVCSKAIDTRYISLDLLTQDGLLEPIPSFKANTNKIEYDQVLKFKRKHLLFAYLTFIKRGKSKLARFIEDNKWVVDYAIYQILKVKNKNKDWGLWPESDLKFFKNHQRIPKEYKEKINFEIFTQYIARKQWDELFDFAHKNNIKIIADIPFYVGYDSIDCLEHKEEFLLDEHYKMTHVGGCPPDAFSDEGQLWGCPIYNFDKMKENNYSFLIDRISYVYGMCDILRLDHFRAFDTYYVIPNGMKNAKIGEWKIGPRMEFFKLLNKKTPGIDLIAEDLGDLVPSVYELKDETGLPGMFILQFAIFDRDRESDNNTIIYIGTHDNDTLVGWYKNLDVYGKTKLFDILDYPKDVYKAVIDYALKIPSKMVIFQLQDLLLLDNRSRINCPGLIIDTNWTWKLKDFTILKKCIYSPK